MLSAEGVVCIQVLTHHGLRSHVNTGEHRDDPHKTEYFAGKITWAVFIVLSSGNP